MWDQFSDPAKQSILSAQRAAGRHLQKEVSVDHMLIGVLEDSTCGASKIAERIGVSCAALMSDVEKRQPVGSYEGADHELSKASKKAIDQAYHVRRQYNRSTMETKHLLYGILKVAEGQGDVLYYNAGLSMARVEPEIARVELDGPNDAIWPPPPTSRQIPVQSAPGHLTRNVGIIALALALASVAVSISYTTSIHPPMPWNVATSRLEAMNLAAMWLGWVARKSPQRRMGSLAITISFFHTLALWN